MKKYTKILSRVVTISTYAIIFCVIGNMAMPALFIESVHASSTTTSSQQPAIKSPVHDKYMDLLLKDNTFVKAKTEIDASLLKYNNSNSALDLSNLKTVLNKYQTAISIADSKILYKKFSQMKSVAQFNEELYKLSSTKRAAIYAMFTVFDAPIDSVAKSTQPGTVSASAVYYSPTFANRTGCVNSIIKMRETMWVTYLWRTIDVYDISYTIRTCANGTDAWGDGFIEGPVCREYFYLFHCGSVYQSKCERPSHGVFSCYYQQAVRQDTYLWGYQSIRIIQLDSTRYANGMGYVYENIRFP